MDLGRTKASRRRRVASAPCLESLEGRRLMAARAGAQVAFKEVASEGSTSLIVTGTSKADVITVSDAGTDRAGNVSVTLGDGTTYTSKAGIAVVQVLGFGGNDRISYALRGELTSSRIVLVDGASGNDRFTADIDGNVANAAGLDVESYGGAGDDTMVVNQRGAVAQGMLISYLQGDSGRDRLAYNGTGAVASGASVAPEFSGGAGDDRIASDYSGVILGNFIYNLSIDGGAGGDDIASNVTAAAGSSGAVGNGAATPAAVQGGAGNDRVRFAVKLDPAVTSFRIGGVAIGNAGRDLVSRTANVEGDESNEKESLIS